MPVAEEGDAFVPFVGDLADVLCAKHQRVVGNDNCVRYDGRLLQLPEQRHRLHFAKASIAVHEYPDGGLAIFQWPQATRRLSSRWSPRHT